jgi:hypothetical protein
MCDDVQLCNRCAREFLIMARTWFAFGLSSKTECDSRCHKCRRWSEVYSIDTPYVLELALRCKLIQRGSVATQTGFLHEMTIALLIWPLKGTVRGYL